MRVLVACEFSGVVRDAFRARGHDAVSCDLLPTEKPGPHIQGDVMAHLGEGWDLIIAHPECTKLTVAGNSTYGEGKPRYQERLDQCAWTKHFWDECKRNAKGVAFENPVSVLRRLGGFPKPQYVHPWQHGHPEQKKTALFLHGLPELVETRNVYAEMMLLPKNVRERVHYMAPSPLRWKLRSTTYAGIADAMAAQWGSLPV